MSEERRERSDRLKSRFDRDSDGDEDAETGEATEGSSDQSDATQGTEQSSADGGAAASDRDGSSAESIKDRPSVLMYLPDELHTELDIRFDEFNARHKREHGRPLEKNRDYYPAVIEASLEGKTIEDVLDI